ncbi:response regulator [Flavisphingomonas formosensis]|uniref:response regulator n=1 Tax=Flavisphingomonas formosensis TaxID=861534 RepID=UPI0012F9D84D|nr:response regulator [Sphingomonas formosensis]
MDDREEGGLILIVDDDADARAMLQQALTGAGFVVASACDGEDALTRIEEARPDLILLDAVMPGIDGFETCRRIKARPAHAAVPVIFMTGLSETRHVVAGLQAGGIDYVTKPILLDELIARVRVHLTNARTMLRAQTALDAAGRRLLSADSSGQIRWMTPLAAVLVERLEDEAGAAARECLARGILAVLAHAARGERQAVRLSVGRKQIEIGHIGKAPRDEHFLRIAELHDGRESLILQRMLNLTPRESDVLFWIAQGKSNRDASEIMNISARTVNKHLEQIFVKLGVENRAGAAAIATRIIALEE